MECEGVPKATKTTEKEQQKTKKFYVYVLLVFTAFSSSFTDMRAYGCKLRMQDVETATHIHKRLRVFGESISAFRKNRPRLAYSYRCVEANSDSDVSIFILSSCLQLFCLFLSFHLFLFRCACFPSATCSRCSRMPIDWVKQKWKMRCVSVWQNLSECHCSMRKVSHINK